MFENAYVNTKFLSWALMIRMPSLVIDETQMAPGTLQLHIAFSPWWTRKIFKFYISVQLWVRCLGKLEEISHKENRIEWIRVGAIDVLEKDNESLSVNI